MQGADSCYCFFFEFVDFENGRLLCVGVGDSVSRIWDNPPISKSVSCQFFPSTADS